MSPTPIIDLQRRLTLVGAIRCGGEKPERGVGKKLEAFRITSPRKQLVEQAAKLYGGSVSPWKSPTGDEFQVYTEAESLPVLVMPSYSLRQTYELWEGATKRVRVCDGVDEELTGGPCLCNAEGTDRCDLYTRLVVALQELDTVLGWRLITRGANAAHELPTIFALIEAQGTRSTFVPARLRLHQRRGVKDGQVVRYVVPTLDLDLSYLGLASPPLDGGEARELPPGGYEPASRREATVKEALSAAVVSPRRQAGRPTAALGPVPDTDSPPVATVREDGAIPPPTPPPPPPESPLGPSEQIPVGTEHADYVGARQTKALTEPQANKLNVLVGQLRTGGHITTESLYVAIAGLRNIEVETMATVIDGRDEAGELHWAPLRDSLVRTEATQLIDWLEEKDRRVSVGPGFGERPAGTPSR